MDITAILSFHNLEIPIEGLRQIHYSAVTRTLYLTPTAKAGRGIRKQLTDNNENFTDTMNILAVHGVNDFIIQNP